MSNMAATGSRAARPHVPWATAAAWEPPDTRRMLQLCLGGLWLLDAILQYQSFMFTQAFGQMLAATAPGNPAVIASPITWAASLVEHHGEALNTSFATVQLLLALGIAWRPTVKIALGGSIAWSLGVWWLGEGLGSALTGNASPVSGAPGAALIYAVLAVLLWPTDRGNAPAPFAPAPFAPAPFAPAPFVAARAVGARASRALWLVLWASMAYFSLLAANRTPQGLHDMISGMAAGEPGWLSSIDRFAAATVAQHGLAAATVLAILLAVIAAGVYLPATAARATLVLAIVVAAAIWVFGEALGTIFTGGGTDPSSGPLLALLALAYWPGQIRIHRPARRSAYPPTATRPESAGRPTANPY